IGILPVESYTIDLVNTAQVNSQPLVVSKTAGPTAVGATIESHGGREAGLFNSGSSCRLGQSNVDVVRRAVNFKFRQCKPVAGKTFLAEHAHMASFSVQVDNVHTAVAIFLSENSGPVVAIGRCLNGILATIGVLPVELDGGDIKIIPQVHSNPLVIAEAAGPTAIIFAVKGHGCSQACVFVG